MDVFCNEGGDWRNDYMNLMKKMRRRVNTDRFDDLDVNERTCEKIKVWRII